MSDTATASVDPKPPVGVDTTRASIARVYDAFLGGKDNYEIDRQVMNGVLKASPFAADMATENRAFLIRACRFMAARAGITQFLDCGSGLPTADNTHQVVQRINVDARVVYIDNDPVVLAHGRALLEENNRCVFISADIFQPHDIMDNDEIRKHLDLSRPIGFLQAGTLHHHAGAKDGPARIMQQFIDALPSGSFVAISHFFDPENEYTPVARKMEHHFVHSPMGSGTFRTRAELLELFDGLELIEPGLVPCVEWWPEGPHRGKLNEAQHCIAGAVGRKP